MYSRVCLFRTVGGLKRGREPSGFSDHGKAEEPRAEFGIGGDAAAGGTRARERAPGIPPPSPVLKPGSIKGSSTVGLWDFTPDLPGRLRALYAQ